jgi:hypothetical protein
MESPFGSPKTERVHRRVRATGNEARRDPSARIEGRHNAPSLHKAQGEDQRSDHDRIVVT